MINFATIINEYRNKVMKKKLFILPVLTAALMLFAACGGEDDPTDNGGGESGGDNTEIPAMNANEAKQSLQSTADELLAKINVKEFDDIKQSLNSIDFEESDVVSDWFSAAKAACEIKVSNADEAHLWKASNFVGAFQLQGDEWKQTRKGGSDLTFTFNDSKGRKCVMTVKASDEATKIHHDAFDEEDWYYDEEGNEIPLRYVNQFMLPKTVNVTLVRNGNTDVDITVNTDVKTDGEIDPGKDELEVTSVIKVAGFEVNVSKASYKAGKTAEASAVISKNGETLITVSADAKGSYSYEDQTLTVNQMNATVDFLGKAKVIGTISDVEKYNSFIDKAYENDGDETWFKKYIESANKLLDAKLYLNGSTNSSAKLYLSPVLDGYEYEGEVEKYWNYEEWMEFTDGSKYSVDSYFNEENFKSVIDQVESLIDDFKDLFGITD